MSDPKGAVISNPKIAPWNTRKQGTGPLRHCAQSLKRIARLSDKDRKEVIHVLKRKMKHRKTLSDKPQHMSINVSATNESQSSVNNDWQSWLVLHGKENKLSQDVCEIGKVVGLKFAGDKNNMFDVLSGIGRKNNGGSGNDV